MPHAFVTSLIPLGIGATQSAFSRNAIAHPIYVVGRPSCRSIFTAPTMALSPGLRAFRRALLYVSSSSSSSNPSTPHALMANSRENITRVSAISALVQTTTKTVPSVARAMVASVVVRPARRSVALMAQLARRVQRVRARQRGVFVVSRMAAGVLVAVGMMAVTRTSLRWPLATAAPAVPTIRLPTAVSSALPPWLAAIIRPFSEAFGVVFLSEFGDKSMFATALMAMKHSPYLVCIGAFAALTLMTFIACFLGQLMRYLPPTITHYSSIALFVLFGLQMILQSRKMSDTPAGAPGGERADAEEMVTKAGITRNSPLYVLAKVSSLIFVAEWCDRSMLATMALAASSNTIAVIGGATFANIICTGMAVFAATLVASRISERLVALVAGLLFEVFAVFTFLEGPES